MSMGQGLALTEKDVENYLLDHKNQLSLPVLTSAS